MERELGANRVISSTPALEMAPIQCLGLTGLVAEGNVVIPLGSTHLDLGFGLGN